MTRTLALLFFLVGLATPAAAAEDEDPAARLAALGIEGEVVIGKIPMLHIVVERGQVLEEIPALREAGLLDASAPGDAAAKHPLAVLRDVALSAMPAMLGALYDQNSAIGSATVIVYARSRAEEEEPKTEILFSFNCGREVADRIANAHPDRARFMAMAPQFHFGSEFAEELSQEGR